jgi:hypothetical protein
LRLSKEHGSQLHPRACPSFPIPSLPPGALPPDTVCHIDEILHCSQSNYGRGTVVWTVHVHRPNQVTSADDQSLPPDGSDYVASEAGTRPLSPSDLPSSGRASPLNDRDRYIVKDIWHDVHRPYTEGEVLQMLDGLSGIPKFRGEYVPDDPLRSHARGLRNFLTEEQYEELLGEGKVEERVRLRLVYGSPDGASDPKAKLIYKYQNRQEVIAALIAIVMGMAIIQLQS